MLSGISHSPEKQKVIKESKGNKNIWKWVQKKKMWQTEAGIQDVLDINSEKLQWILLKSQINTCTVFAVFSELEITVKYKILCCASSTTWECMKQSWISYSYLLSQMGSVMGLVGKKHQNTGLNPRFVPKYLNLP